MRDARRVFRGGTVYGVIFTLGVLAFTELGAFDNLENWLYDKRAGMCQLFAPPPTDKLVHLDIDDGALDAIGNWPWRRATLAQLVDEMALAQPKALALDVLFAEPQGIRLARDSDGNIQEINDDKLFADSLRKLGRALVPLSLKIVNTQAPTPSQQTMRTLLLQNLELTESDMASALGTRGKSLSSVELREFLDARVQAMHVRVRDAIQQNPPITLAQLRNLLLPHTDSFVTTPAVRALEEASAEVSTDLALLPFTRPIPPGMPPLLQVPEAITPVPALAKAAAATAFFDYPKEKSGVVRRVPLFMEHEGRMYPQIGIELAAMMLGADLQSMKFTDRSIEITRLGQSPLLIPVYTYYSVPLHRSVPMMFDIPWYGSDNWETMYDKVGGAHLSMNAVWDVCLTQQKIQHNNRAADDGLQALYEVYSPEKLQPFKKLALPLNDPLVRLRVCQAAIDELKPFIDAAESATRADAKDDNDWLNTQKLAASGRALRNLVDENPKLGQQLVSRRAELRQRLQGRAILVGWASTSSLADLVPTSIHPRCPGVVIHGTIFNAIMTGRVWRRVPTWLNAIIIVLLGLVASLLATRLTPARGLVYALLLGAFYTAINGELLFDYGNWIVSLAGPLVAMAVVWAGCTLVRLLVEGRERARILRRFRAYMDPTLVDYVEAHPDEARFDGQMREMTVVFTDLEGFTTLTEQLGEKAIVLLNEFMSLAVPVIRGHQGFLNKLLGDGIMFFFGAPIVMPDHAARAAQTVLDLRVAVAKLNESLLKRGLPAISVRAGISSGQMLVGDAGGEEVSDYTVLGDCVNLGARLESANKAIGTHCLMSARTVELSQGKFLTRPIGKLRVVGKQTGVMTYELLALASEATVAQEDLARLSTAVVNAYLQGNLPACLVAVQTLETAFGPTRFSQIYREQCEQQRNSPADLFDPAITLTEK